MVVQTIDAKTITKMFLAGANRLEEKKEWINELNVFPVPDGDTGTNMTLTIMSAAKEVAAIEDMNMEVLAKAISSGSLRGARGNSGVILSQLLRGFTKVIREYQEIDATILANAMNKASETAYKAVMKPKEGTILTVARGAAEKAAELVSTTDDLTYMIDEIIKYADEVLSKTPDMLPVLKQAGVVDSGGQGLIEVLKGAYDAFLGKDVDATYSEKSAASKSSYSTTAGNIEAQAAMDIKFGYCTEFIIMVSHVFNAKNEIDLKAYLESIGDSIVVVADDDIVKVHVHTNDPGLAIQKALTYGSLTSMKIDNMREEHEEKLFKLSEKAAQDAAAANSDKKAKEDEKNSETITPLEEMMQAPAERKKDEEPKKEYGFIAVSVGDGMNAIFKGLGVDYLIEGGQTMNPSTEDMLNAIDAVHADNIFILPNNKNIILAANQAKSLVEDKNVIVIPTKTTPQGITAIINFVPDQTPEENEALMTEEIKKVKTGQVTYAVRDTVINDKEIKQGNIMGIGDHDILSVGTVVEDTAREMLDHLVDDDSELISIYYGADVDEEVVGDFAAEVEEAYPDCDIEVHSGGQPIYYYIISVE
ncbi:MAG TPA: DAK2 domain-containing protein [Lachnospiraceae bacterium]|nr:DAK2 domain-containing protein [Lachnospiraceae bacterium]